RHVSRPHRRGRPDPAGAGQPGQRLHAIAAGRQTGRRSAHRTRAPRRHGRRIRRCVNIPVKSPRSTAMSGLLKWCVAMACVVALGGAAAGPAGAQAPKRGGTAIVGVSVAGATLNTQLTSAVTPLIIADLWANGLYKYDKNGAKKPQIASSWEVS